MDLYIETKFATESFFLGGVHYYNYLRTSAKNHEVKILDFVHNKIHLPKFSVVLVSLYRPRVFIYFVQIVDASLQEKGLA